MAVGTSAEFVLVADAGGVSLSAGALSFSAVDTAVMSASGSLSLVSSSTLTATAATVSLSTGTGTNAQFALSASGASLTGSLSVPLTSQTTFGSLSASDPSPSCVFDLDDVTSFIHTMSYPSGRAGFISDINAAACWMYGLETRRSKLAETAQFAKTGLTHVPSVETSSELLSAEHATAAGYADIQNAYHHDLIATSSYRYVAKKLGHPWFCVHAPTLAASKVFVLRIVKGAIGKIFLSQAVDASRSLHCVVDPETFSDNYGSQAPSEPSFATLETGAFGGKHFSGSDFLTADDIIALMPGYSYLLYYDAAAQRLTPLLAAPSLLEVWPDETNLAKSDPDQTGQRQPFVE
jgi:hypothetical protein